MRKPKPAFMDPHTGEEMESTWLARLSGVLASVLVSSLFGLLWLFGGILFGKGVILGGLLIFMLFGRLGGSL